MKMLFATLLLPLAVSAEIVLTEPADRAIVPLLTDAQKAYVLMPTAERRDRFASASFRRGQMGLPVEKCDGESRQAWWPKTVRLSWKADPGVTNTVRLTEKGASGPLVEREVVGGTLVVDNLKIATEYVWSVSNGAESASRTFVTEDLAPRLISDPHVPNARDLGGRIGIDGRRVRQGLVFRTAGLNENARLGRPNPDELASADPDGAIAALGPAEKALAATWRKISERGGSFTPTGVTLPESVRVKRLGNGVMPLRAAALLAAEAAHPDEESDEEIRSGENGVFRFGEPGDGRWRLVKGVLKAEADGFALIGVAADWYWALAVNGTVVRDQLAGNGREVGGEPHTVAFPVRRGDNTLRLVVGSGSQGFLLQLTEAPAVSLPKTAAAEANLAGRMMESLVRHASGLERGPTRIHDDNRDFWLKTLGVRTDIDLRSDKECTGMTGSPLGETVTWAHISSSAYSGMQSPWGRKSFEKVFRVFLDERNYPIVFHCIAGQDRTGAVAYILNALLGVSEDELAVDWEVTGFRNRNPNFNHERLYDRLTAGFQERHPAATVRERAEAYVKSLGFTDDDLAQFRSIMLETK